MLGIGNISISRRLVSYGIASREMMFSSPTELSSLEKNWSFPIYRPAPPRRLIFIVMCRFIPSIRVIVFEKYNVE
jgi:hypothetical protein